LESSCLATDRNQLGIIMPLMNKTKSMKRNSSVDLNDIEFEIGLESSIQKEGG